jgi:hypothetical protein
MLSGQTNKYDTIQITVCHSPDGSPYIECGDQVIATKYRRFHDIKECLSFLCIKQYVDEYVEKGLKGFVWDTRGTDVCFDDDLQASPAELKAAKGNRAAYNALYKKLYNEAIFKKTHVPQQLFIKLMNGKMFEAFVKPIPVEIKKRLCHGKGGKLSTDKVNNVIRVLPLLVQADADKQYNLLPLIMLFGKSPKEIKEHLGKGLWKRLCANTFSRNKAICDYARGVTRDPYRAFNFNDDIEALLRESTNVPTTLLRYDHPVYTLQWLGNSSKGKWKDSIEIKRRADLFRDTLRMKLPFGAPIKDVEKLELKMVKWSYRRLFEEHEIETHKAHAAKYSDKEYFWTKYVPIGQFMYDGYLVTPLFNSRAIGMEGHTMHHCVGSYAQLSERGDYLVFSVTKDGIPHSTIGMYMNMEFTKAPEYPMLGPLELYNSSIDVAKLEVKIIDKLVHLSVHFQQMYGMYNSKIDENDPAKQLPTFIENILNNRNSEYKPYDYQPLR